MVLISALRISSKSALGKVAFCSTCSASESAGLKLSFFAVREMPPPVLAKFTFKEAPNLSSSSWICWRVNLDVPISSMRPARVAAALWFCSASTLPNLKAMLRFTTSPRTGLESVAVCMPLAIGANATLSLRDCGLKSKATDSIPFSLRV